MIRACERVLMRVRTPTELRVTTSTERPVSLRVWDSLLVGSRGAFGIWHRFDRSVWEEVNR